MLKDKPRFSRFSRFVDNPIILPVFVVLALIYAWATPPLEASDELWHFGMVQHIAETGQLPVQQPGVETIYEQEGSQPPLYYFIAAVLVKLIDRSDFDLVRQPNPHAKAGIPGDSDNKNLVLHDTPHPPLQGTALAVCVVRLFSIALGCVTVFAVYRVGLILGGDSLVAMLAAGLTAFNPMFLFVTASVNNDNLVIALNSLIIWQMLELVGRGFSLKRTLIIAVLLALASLSKLNALALLPTLALAALWVAYQRKTWRGLIAFSLMAGAVWLVLAGWWYVRNLTLYGELFGTRTMVAVAGARLEPFTLDTLWSEFEGFRIAYWGLFGAVNVMTFKPFYLVMDAVVLLAVVGLMVHLWRQRAERAHTVQILLLSLIFVTGSIALIFWTAQTYASQGRLLFPFVAAICSLLAIGLAYVIRVKHALLLQRIIVGALAGFAFIVPFTSIAPQYAPPPPLTDLPASARPVYARYGDVELVGYETPDQRYAPGEQVPITVYWKVRERSSRDLSLYLHVVNPDGGDIGKIDSFPGGGRLRTLTWQPGAIYADSYLIPLVRDAAGQFKLRVQVGWWHYASGEVINPVDADGAWLDSVMLDAGGFASTGYMAVPGEIAPTERVDFGGVIVLTGYVLQGDHLMLIWEATGTPAADYTVFAQILDETNTLVGQGDAPPVLPTRYWRSGERYVTRHTLTYPVPPAAGTYRLIVGWYKPDDFSRLSANYPDSAYSLTEIHV